MSSISLAAVLSFCAAACGDLLDVDTSPVDEGNEEEEVESVYSFHDEFDGDEVDLTKWTFQNGDGSDYGIPGWGNNEKQYYRAENATVEDGLLKITARVEEYGGKKYTSAKLVTQGIFSQTYGRFEARIMLTSALEGLWPAFWMMPADSEYGGWPRSGEIDIMEIKGRIPDNVSSTLHFGNPHNYIYKNYQYPNNGKITDFHVYAVDWTPESMKFSVDGEVYHIIRSGQWYTDGKGGGENPDAPFDEDFFIILNLAVGGNFDGGRTPPDDMMPAQLWVDYVRVYDLDYLLAENGATTDEGVTDADGV